MTRRRPALAAALAAAAATCTLAACGTAAPDSTGSPVPAGLENYYTQQLAWGACAPFAPNDVARELFADATLECARLVVPLDYAQPNGRTAQIAVLRNRTDAADRIGSLVVNPGGPGGSGTELAAILSTGFADGRFDIVGFDPRGVGASTPMIDCETDAEIDESRTDVVVSDEMALPDDMDATALSELTPAEIAEIEDVTRDYGQQCATRSGGVDVLANVGTRDVARDMDVLRAVLGDPQLTYLGFSYGTRLGTTYAEMFPRNVRALVLDGVDDTSQTAADSLVAQYTAFQASTGPPAPCPTPTSSPARSPPCTATRHGRC